MNEPIPFTAKEPLDLSKIATEAVTPDKPLSLRDACVKFGFSHCLTCFRGGHTRTPLFKVFTDGTGREMGYACPDHVRQFLRPKDVGAQ
jgi:hypothetical protein